VPGLRRFQREDVDRIKEAGLRALVASSPGTGKTIVSIASIIETARSLPALVVCPASVTLNWARELQKWAPNLQPIVIDDGSSEIQALRGAVYIISWALLDTRWTDLLQLQLQTIVADEAHFAKSEEALRSQALYRLTRKIQHILLLSGTPIINHEGELRALKALLGDKPLMIRRLLEDVEPDIPPKTRNHVPIKLRPEHEVIYDKASADFESWLLDRQKDLKEAGLSRVSIERTLAAESLTKIGYLRRLVGEFKVPAAVEWIAKAVRVGEPVVVFCEHQNVVRKLSRGLKRQRIRHGILDGNTPVQERQGLIDDFQDHKLPVFIGTRAAKEGITLTAARHLLFVERFYTSAEEEQAEDRIRRIGQKYPTTIWYLHAYGTTDDRVDVIVRTKRQVIRTAIGSKTTAESPLGNVAALLSSWSNHVGKQDHGKASNLGFGGPLPPLPPAARTHGVVFYGERWTAKAATWWCKMNGYEPRMKIEMQGRFKLVVQPTQLFRSRSFSSFKVCKDVMIIVGRRLGAQNRRIVQRSR